MAISPIEGNVDTGWVSLVPYVATGFAARKTNMESTHCPAYRIINGIVYFKGQVYSTTNKNSKRSVILENIPNVIRPQSGEPFLCSGKRFMRDVSYGIFYDTGNIRVDDAETIGVHEDWQGYSLGAMCPYPVL